MVSDFFISGLEPALQVIVSVRSRIGRGLAFAEKASIAPAEHTEAALDCSVFTAGPQEAVNGVQSARQRKCEL